MNYRIKRPREMQVNNINIIVSVHGTIPISTTFEQLSACRLTTQKAMLMMADEFML